MSATQKPFIAPMCSFFAVPVMVIDGVLHQFRLLAYLHAPTVLSAGQEVPTARFARYQAHFSYCLGIISLVGGVYGYLTLTEAKRRYIAQLPRWQQWLWWPFHGVSPSEITDHNSFQHPPAA